MAVFEGACYVCRNRQPARDQGVGEEVSADHTRQSKKGTSADGSGAPEKFHTE